MSIFRTTSKSSKQYHQSICFFATLFTYNFQRLVRMDVQGELSHRQQWFIEHKKWLWFTTIVSAFTLVYLSFSLSIESLVLLIPLGVIALIYPLPTISLNGRILRLREVPGIKIFLIAFVWALVTVGLLVQEHQLAWTTDVWLLFFHRFCFVFAITIPFDIRDLKYDQLQLKTIPGLFGEEKARYIALAVLALYELLIIIQFVFGEIINLSALIALLGTSAVTAYLLIRSNSEKRRILFCFLGGGSIAADVWFFNDSTAFLLISLNPKIDVCKILLVMPSKWIVKIL